MIKKYLLKSIYLFPFVLGFTILLLSACELEQEVQINQHSFFDLKGFFEGEQARLKTKKEFIKSVKIDGQEEEEIFNQLDLEKELAIFKNSDINKVAWLDKYSVDTTFSTARQVSSILYTANDKDLRTQSLKIDFNKEKVSQIVIKNKSKSMIASTDQVLTYTPNKGYTVRSGQDMALLDGFDLDVQVRFAE